MLDDSNTSIKTMAVIKNVSFGLRTKGNIEPKLWFTVWLSEKFCYELSFSKDALRQFLFKTKVLDVNELENHPCWVYTNGTTVSWCGLFKIPNV